MRKTILFIVLLIGLGFSVVNLTPQQAGDIAGKYKETTETVDLSPTGLTYSGDTPYYVMELKGALSTIAVMLPINAETKQVEYGDSVIDLLKTHYLANYFADNTGTGTIPDFLDSTLSWAQGVKNQYNHAITDLSSNEAQLPTGVTLTTLQPLKDALADANAKNDALRDSIQKAQTIISSLTWSTTDVDLSNSALTGVFSNEDAFLNSMNVVKDASNNFTVEVLSNSYLKTDQTRSQALILIVSTYNLQDGAPITTSDTLTTNKNSMIDFYNGLDLVSQSYLVKLRERLDAYTDPTEIAAIRKALTDYSTNYTAIVGNSGSMTPTCVNNIETLRTTITEAEQYFNNGNYTQAKANFDSIDGQISSLMSCIGQCPPQCSNGKVPNSDCQCVCPAGTTESDGQCVGGFSMNLPLIGGLILIIALLIVFKYKDRIFPKGGGEIEEKPKDAWTNYKF